MSAVFGMVGECDDSELHEMGVRLAHCGPHIDTWSPARDVHFGEVRFWPRTGSEDPCVAGCLHFSMDWDGGTAGAGQSAAERNARRQRHLSDLLTAGPGSAAAALDGPFAFACWDAGRRQLSLCVDRIGGQQLFYVRTPRGIYFASHYKALLAIGDVQAAANADAWQFAIATSMIDLGTTMARDIRRVPQAHSVVFDGRSEQCSAYWQARLAPRRTSRSVAARELREVLVRQVRRSLAPYPRIAITLSGGLDSSGLLALIRHVYPEKPVATYTIGYSGEDPEIAGARESADHFGTDHTELLFRPGSIVTDLPRLVWLAEELAGREEAVLQYQVERHLVDQEEVLVAGHGADMVFAGMPRHRLIRMAETIPFAKRGLTELFQQTQSGALPESVTGRLASFLLYRGRSVAPPVIRGATAESRVYEPVSLGDFIEHTICEMPEFHYHSGTQSEAPIEPVMPFLSNAVVEHSLQVPTALKTTIRRQKIVLRDALSALLPDSIRLRGKAIQRVRHDRELTEVLDHMADRLLDPSSIRDRGLVDPAYVAGLRRKDDSAVYSDDRLSRLWMLLVCELWCRTFVDGRGRSPVDIGGM